MKPFVPKTTLELINALEQHIRNDIILEWHTVWLVNNGFYSWIKSGTLKNCEQSNPRCIHTLFFRGGCRNVTVCSLPQPHFGTWILLFGPFGQLRAVRKTNQFEYFLALVTILKVLGWTNSNRPWTPSYLYCDSEHTRPTCLKCTTYCTILPTTYSLA